MTLWLLVLSFGIHVHTAAKQGEDGTARLDSLLNGLWVDGTSSDELTTSLPLGPRPFFEEPQRFVNLTAQAGALVVLHCKVNDLTDRTSVSWLRRRGARLDLVSVGLEVYSSDTRYSVHFDQLNDWQLHLKPAAELDDGPYECQVSSHPPLVHTVYLTIVVPELEILDERGQPTKNKFYNSGSTIELKCVISKVPQPTQFIIWNHGTNILNYDITRGGISVKTDIVSDGAKSRLFIANASPADSGNYTCSLGEMAATSILVHVLNGETPAAMQHGGSGRSRSVRLTHMIVQLGVSWLVINVR
ncbi:zwei Ig domain protein zig-8 isoform X10 [Nilaparvata lugens]|uniref:zwei Ig domain protein zig-8 isoform X10 n=1 Tax=Nilaparvata lugens TaxID=108931 RepID=UPI00193D1906|nr:zwei Ig domain protein zig-8 isoform X10 [Nilaparvata lugens]XP_039281875.1 zwei Ig domain protein zig-8 isoform X10 [Nilaparvata lugens]